MRYRVFVVLVILVAIVSSCGSIRSLPEHGVRFNNVDYEDSLAVDFFDKPITISNIESEKLSRRNYFSGDRFTPFLLTFWIGGATSLAYLFNVPYLLGFGYTVAGSSLFLLPAYSYLGDIDLHRSKTNLYKEELDSLSLTAFEELLVGDDRLNYIENSKVGGTDSVYSINVEIKYTLIENNEKMFSGRRDSPQMVADWTIYSPNNERMAHFRTSNRMLVNERNVVHPRRTKFRNVYTELAHQSAESFIALLNGEDDLHVPSSPLGIRVNSDANVLAYEYIGRSPLLSDLHEYFNIIAWGLSRHQYLVNIDRGRTAGFDEGKSYRVLIPAKTNDEFAPDDNTGDNLNNALDISTEAYWVIGWFEALLVGEDMSIGIIRLLRKYSNDVDYIFSDEIVRGYDFYPTGDMRPKEFPGRD